MSKKAIPIILNDNLNRYLGRWDNPRHFGDELA